MKKPALSLDSVSPLFQKIEKLTKVQRMLIIISSFVILLGAFGYFSYYPKYQNISKLKKDLAQEEAKLEKAKANAKELNTWRAKMKSAEEKFNLSKMALPENEEIPSLLASVSQSGKDAGLNFLLFQPKPEEQKDFYAEIPVSINVAGDYHQVASFFDKVGALSRIVNVKDIHIAPLAEHGQTENGQLKTTCTAVTYKFSESTPKKDKADKSKKKK
jgi:type IV pilus assembly protein PilO